jgi:integrase/recombinase XerD
MKKSSQKDIATSNHKPFKTGKKGGQKPTPDGFNRSDVGTLASLMDAWFRRLEERRYSQGTVEARKWALRSFLKWSEERDLLRPGQFTKPILENFQRWLYIYRKVNGAPLAVASQRTRLGAVQVFFAWLCRQNILLANPAADLELPRKPHRSLPKSLSQDAIRAILATPDTGDPLGLRDRAILEMFYATGIRRKELVHLDLEDVDCSSGLLAVRKGKGGKDRMLPLGEHAANWMVLYLERTRPLLDAGQTDRALFLSGFGERMSIGYLSNRVRQILVKAGFPHHGSCHVFRHSCATHMLENGADIRIIQELLGHDRLDTTQIYAAVTITHLRAVHARTHPRAHITPGQLAPGQSQNMGQTNQVGEPTLVKELKRE